MRSDLIPYNTISAIQIFARLKEDRQTFSQEGFYSSSRKMFGREMWNISDKKLRQLNKNKETYKCDTKLDFKIKKMTDKNKSTITQLACFVPNDFCMNFAEIILHTSFVWLSFYQHLKTANNKFPLKFNKMHLRIVV